MNTARALARAGLDSEELRDTLHPVRPEGLWLRSASSLLRRLWPEGVTAMTFGPWILVDRAVLNGDARVLGRLTVHELVHVRQFHDLGLAGFARRYLGDYLRGRVRGLDHAQAYRGIGLEEEARRITRRLSGEERS